MQVQKLNYLSSIQVFRDLSPTELAEMDRQITMSTCEPGKIFYMPEDSGEILFLLKRGQVQIYRLASRSYIWRNVARRSRYAQHLC